MQLGARRRAGRVDRGAASCCRASCTSAARSSSTWKARSPTRSRRKTAACWCSARPSIRARCSTSSRMRWACIVAPGAGRMPAHGRRLRRQGIAVGAVGGGGGHRRGAAEAPGQAARRPRRRHARHRQAPLLLLRIRSRLRRRRPHPRREGRHGHAAPAIRPTCPARSPRARSATSTMPITCPTSTSAPPAARPTPSPIPPSAASAARRARSPSNT